MTNSIELENVREYAEELPVELCIHKGREVIHATNEGGFNSTSVDLLDMIAWLKKNRPELLADDTEHDEPECEPEWAAREPMTESQKEYARAYIFSDAPEEMKREMGIKPLVFVNQDGVVSDPGSVPQRENGLFELGREMARKQNEAVWNAIIGE